MKYSNTGLYHYCLNLGNHLQKVMAGEPEQLHLYAPAGIKQLFGQSGHHIPQKVLHKLHMPSLGKYDVWHATHQDSYYLPFRNRSIKVVLTIHDLNFLYDPKKQQFKKQRNLRRVQMLIDRADVIVCVSEFCKKDVLFYCDVKNKPLHVIYNGTNSLGQPVLSRTSYRPRKPFLFSIGTVVRKKNFHSLLALVQKDSDMELVIAGRIDDAGYAETIYQMAVCMGIADNIRLIGPVSEEEKSWYFENCCAFAFPSISEGFGLPVTEAMSVGKPLFLSNKTALPEIAGNVAFYFKDFSESTMLETFQAGMKQYKLFNMSEDIINKGKSFCWHQSALQYLEVYRTLGSNA